MLGRVAKIGAAAGALASLMGGAIVVWRKDPRVGSDFVNRVVNPRLLDLGLAGGEHSEIGPIEHVGRRSGIRRLTPVHPEPTLDGFRVMVPLGAQSEWARNVLESGHCRLQLHGNVYDLDDPVLLPAREVQDLPKVSRSVMSVLGFCYLRLHTASVKPGTLRSVHEQAYAFAA